MSQATFIFEFESELPEQAAAYLDELRETILDQSENIKVEKYRDKSSKQDFFTGLAVVLGTPAVIALAKAIGDWLKLRQSAAITIKTTDGQIMVKNLTSDQAAGLADKFLEKTSREIA
jgi:Lhr-like helicase